jgi:hypothetical protein
MLCLRLRHQDHRHECDQAGEDPAAEEPVLPLQTFDPDFQWQLALMVSHESIPPETILAAGLPVQY